MRVTRRRKNTPSSKCCCWFFPSQIVLFMSLSFLVGCVVCSTLLLYWKIMNDSSDGHHIQPSLNVYNTGGKIPFGPLSASSEQEKSNPPENYSSGSSSSTRKSNKGGGFLQGLRILVAIASFDFSQFPLLEEVLDSYQDVCVAGAEIDVYIHTVVPYTVGLIDMLNARLSCETMTVKIAVQSPGVRLNLVDCHRELFYEKIDSYDLFIYSEDDIKVSPTTIKAYLQETERVQDLVGRQPAEDYNIGIVRYEYNYPPDIIIDDKTRHATEHVSRVYWEHLWKPLFPKSIDVAPQAELQKNYVFMQNHHQGMFLATQQLLKAWKERKGCNFDKVRQRPGRKDNPSQPSEGTQRVWMSSQMLHGKSHCNVQQLIPMRNFGQLTVWHLPNKNYRRVGKKGRIGGGSVENEFGNKGDKFAGPDPSLPTEMELHLEMRRLYPVEANGQYTGIQMIDQVDRQRGIGRSLVGMSQHDYLYLLDERMDAYHEYVQRGGLLVDKDFQNWQWTLGTGRRL